MLTGRSQLQRKDVAGGPVSQFHVSQIETHIREHYADEYWVGTIDDVNNLSRLLALHSVNLVLGDADDDGQRIVEITDGTGDRGIDAVGVDQATKLIVLVQSKWRQNGTGSLSLAEVLKFLDGVRALLGMRTDEQPFHALEKTRAVVRTLLKTPGARIRLVTATTGSDPLAGEVERPIIELMEQLNDLEGTEPLAMHSHLGQASFFNSLTKATRPAVDLEIQMQDWGRASEPLRVFYGRVSAAEIVGGPLTTELTYSLRIFGSLFLDQTSTRVSSILFVRSLTDLAIITMESRF